MNRPTGELGAQLGVVVKVVSKYWPVLPSHVKVWYDLSDMIDDGVCNLLKYRDQFDPSKASPSTFIYTITQRFCWKMIDRHTKLCRNAPVVSYTDLREEGVVVDYCEREALGYILGVVNDETREFLGSLLGDETAPRRRIHQNSKRWERIRKELLRWDLRMGGGVRQSLLSAVRVK